MRIGIAIEKFRSSLGGAERSTTQIAAELARRGHCVSVLTGVPEPDPSRHPEGVDVLACPTGPPRGLFGVAPFVRWVREQYQTGRFDVTLSMTTLVPANVLQPRAGLIGEARKRRRVQTPPGLRRWFHAGLHAASPRYRALLHFERSTLCDPMVRAIVPISHYMQGQIQDTGLVGLAPLHLIPNGAEVPELEATQRAAARARIHRGFGVPDHSLVFLFLANDAARKGGATLLRAMSRLVGERQPIVALVGGPMCWRMQQLAVELEVRSHVRFVGSTERVADLYAAADVTVLPSFYDPASKVILESLMLGVPAITSVYNGASDHLVDPVGRRRGRIVKDPADDVELAAAMRELADPAVHAECCATLGPKLRQELSMARHVDRLEELLQRVSGQPVRLAHESPALAHVGR